MQQQCIELTLPTAGYNTGKIAEGRTDHFNKKLDQQPMKAVSLGRAHISATPHRNQHSVVTACNFVFSRTAP